MTEYQKDNIRTHIDKYSIVYSLVGFMIGVVVLIALEAKGII